MMFGSNRGSHIATYATHDKIDDYLSLGWVYSPALENTHHGLHASLMLWICDCPCPSMKAHDAPTGNSTCLDPGIGQRS